MAQDYEPNLVSQRLADLERRLDAEEKSRLKRFGAWCGVVALLISILTGVFGFIWSFAFCLLPGHA